MQQASTGMRVAVASLGVLHAATFGWAAFTLPWKEWTAFGLATGLVAVGHAAVACLAVLGRPELAKVWRTHSFLCLAWAGAVGVWLLHSAWRIASLYEGLGEGVAAALLTVYAATLLFAVPFAFWGIGWTGGVRPSRGATVVGSAIALLLIGWLANQSSSVTSKRLLRESQSQTIAQSLRKVRTEPLTFGSRSLFYEHPTACEQGFDKSLVSVIITFRRSLGTGPNTAVESLCIQDSAARVVAKVQTELDARYAQGRVKIDIIHSVATVDTEDAFATLMVRPGLDGLCWSNRCFAPWQMVATSAFITHTPFSPVPDARMGVSFKKLRHELAGSDMAANRATTNDAQPKRIETLSLLLDGAQAHDMARVPNGKAALTSQALEQSMARANTYIRESLRPDGTFNYLLDPYTGAVTMGSLSLPRQAGTTLVLCELGDPASTATARHALDAIARYTRPIEGDASLLSVEAPSAQSAVRVGSSALSLVALLRCRDRVGKRHDRLITRVANALLKLQQPDGSFWHALDAQGRPYPQRSIYIDGQIMFALVLLEGSEQIEGVDRTAVKETLDRAYAYFAEAYWPAMLGDFFYLEENWHCLAARAALSVHRHNGYERFCVDYARMKSRVLLGDDVHPDFRGGWGLGNVVPPHNTGTAGFGEAAAAALAVARHRGDDEAVSALSHALERSLTFLLRNQLGGPSCFACTDEPLVEGAFSEHMASPTIRIDYVQHAMAALGHGGRALGLLGES